MSAKDLKHFEKKANKHNTIHPPVDLNELLKNKVEGLNPVEERHDPAKFKVGDKVRVVKKVESYTGGWDDAWVWQMEVKDILTVENNAESRPVKNKGYRLSNGFYYPSQSLELVVEQKKPTLLETFEQAREDGKKLESLDCGWWYELPYTEDLSKLNLNMVRIKPEAIVGELELPANNPEAESSLGTEKSLDSHYKYYFNGVKLDPYRILEVYGITNPAQQHAIKKLLRAGKSVKDLKQDIEEVQMTLTRWLEMIEENGK